MVNTYITLHNTDKYPQTDINYKDTDTYEGASLLKTQFVLLLQTVSCGIFEKFSKISFFSLKPKHINITIYCLMIQNIYIYIYIYIPY